MNSKEIVSRRIGALGIDLQHYTMVEKDEFQARLIAFQLEEYRIIKQDLDRLEQLEKLVWKKVEELVNEEYRSKELYDKNIELKQENKELKEKVDEFKLAIEILKDFVVIGQINGDYLINANGFDKLSQGDYNLLKQVFESVGDKCDRS